MRQNQRTQNGDSPVSPRPPTSPAGCPYGDVKHRCRRGRIKIKPAKVSQPEMAETTYQRCARATQPCGNPSRGCLKVYRLSRRRGRIKNGSVKLKIECISINQAGENENTYRGRVQLAQPPLINSKRFHRVIGPSRQPDCIKIEPVKLRIERISDKTVEEDETTYRICANVAQPPANVSKHHLDVYRPIHRCGRVKL